MIKDIIQPKTKMLKKLETSMAWIIFVSMCTLIIILKFKGYEIALVNRYGVWYIEEIEGEKVFYLSHYWVGLALLCIIIIGVRGFSK